jgi:ADP-ribose pyrophosphatase YjhB (NUDIX family)
MKRVPAPLETAAFRVAGWLPPPVRDWLIGLSSPPYRIGTCGLVVRDDGTVLLARHTYRSGWGVPGGMLGWREQPVETIVREMREEVSLDTEVSGEADVIVTRRPRRVVFVYPLRLATGPGARHEPVAGLPEIAEVGWFDPAAPPPLDAHAADLLAPLVARRGPRPGDPPVPSRVDG